MKKIIFCLTLILATKAHANWFCEEGSSQKLGSTIETCGVGTGLDENQARVNAFENAKLEYSLVCNESSDCKDHKVTVTPKRTSCEKSLHGFTCWRMLAYEISDEKQSIMESIAYTRAHTHIRTMGESYPELYR